MPVMTLSLAAGSEGENEPFFVFVGSFFLYLSVHSKNVEVERKEWSVYTHCADLTKVHLK